MPHSKKPLSRREFLQVVSTAGVGLTAAVGSWGMSTNDPLSKSAPVQIPKRKFGKTGVDVPILALGGSINLLDNGRILRQAYRYGITYWDVAHSYSGGNSEKGVGEYLTVFPRDRKNIFLVTKSSAHNVRTLERELEMSLERMKTDYVDMFFIHHVDDAEKTLNNELKKWSEAMKAKKKFKLFGFSTHKNMEHWMMAASKLGWIDGIMMSYNYRLMVKDDMKRAVDACSVVGIGLTAMKTQASFFSSFYARVGKESDESTRLAQRLQARGFSEEQARLKAVWEDPRIASICSKMPNFSILQANAAAAMDKKELSVQERDLLQEVADLTAPAYCAGCANLCEKEIENKIPICDILRYMMYAESYNEREEASKLFRALPISVRSTIAQTDYTIASQRCPHKINIKKMMNEAVRLLG